MWMLLVFVALFATACPAAVCESVETRCAGDVVQICNANGQWQDVMDCTDVEPGSWECGEDDGEHTCSRSDQ